MTDNKETKQAPAVEADEVEPVEHALLQWSMEELRAGRNATVETNRGFRAGYRAAPTLASEAAINPTLERIAQALHYPACWDTAAYPTLDSAIWEVTASNTCSLCQDANTAPAKQEPAHAPIGQYDLTTSTGGRGYLVEFFAKRLHTHTYRRYIEEQLAADFACSLSKYLSGHYGAPAAPAMVVTTAEKTSNPHRGGTVAYLATEHYNEGWNDCLKEMGAAAPAVAPEVPIELRDVEAVLAEGDGFWRSCSGCHETNEGCETGHYPYSSFLKCILGAGCSECGGIGAVWDNTDYDAMAAAGDADEIAREDAAPAPVEPESSCDPADICAGCRCKFNTYAAPVEPKGEQQRTCKHGNWINGCALCADEPEQRGATLSDEQRRVIEMLLTLAREALNALDNSEEREGEHGRCHVIDAGDFDHLSNALDALEELPDDKPGYTMAAPGKAEWALRALLAAHNGGKHE